MFRKLCSFSVIFLIIAVFLLCGCSQKQEPLVQELEPIDEELETSIEEQEPVETHLIKPMIEEVYFVTDITEVSRDLSADHYFLILVIYDKEKFEKHINTEAGSFYRDGDSEQHFPQIVAGDGSQCSPILMQGDSKNTYIYYLAEQGTRNFSIKFRDLALLDLSQYNPVTVDQYSFD